MIVWKSTLASCGRSLLSSPKSRPDRSKVMPDWAPDWAARADRSMFDRSMPDMSRFGKIEAGQVHAGKVQARQVHLHLAGVDLEGSGELGLVHREQGGHVEAAGLALLVVSQLLEGLAGEHIDVGLARWALTIGLAAASSMIW